MFIVNGSLLTKKDQPELWSWYQKQLKELREADKKKYTFASRKRFHFETDTNGRKRRRKQNTSVPPTSACEVEGFGAQTWTYIPTANSIKNENGMISALNPKPFLIGNSTSYSTNEDLEIVFFLTQISGALKNGHISMIDKDQDNLDQAKVAMLESEAYYLVYNNQSPISVGKSGNEKAIRNLARSYGLLGIDTMGIAEVQNKLWAKLQGQNKNKAKINFGKFIEDVYKSQDQEKRSLIMLAVERKVIYYENQVWFLNVRGEHNQQLCTIPANQDSERFEILVGYILDNEEYIDIIKESIDNPVKRIVKQNTPMAQRQELMNKIVTELGWDRKVLFRKKNDELNNIYNSKLAPEKST